MRRGFSLVEVLIGTSLLIMAGLLLATVLSDSFKSQKGVDTQIDTTEFLNEFYLSFSKTNVCSRNMRRDGYFVPNTYAIASPPTTISITRLDDVPRAGEHIAINQKPPGYDNFKITKLELNNIKLLDASVSVYSRYIANLHIQLTKLGDVSGSQTTSGDIPIRLNTVPNIASGNPNDVLLSGCVSTLTDSGNEVRLLCTFLNASWLVLPSINPSHSDICGLIPPGTVNYFYSKTCPKGWIPADGGAVTKPTATASVNEYLFQAIGTKFGSAASDEFKTPDLSSNFIRSFNNSSTAGIDKGRTFGSKQDSAFKAYTLTFTPDHPHYISNANHSHGVTDPGHQHTHDGKNSGGGGTGSNGIQLYTSGGSSTTDNVYTKTTISSSTTNSSGISLNNSPAYNTAYSAGSGAETYPSHVALLPCIKL